MNYNIETLTSKKYLIIKNILNNSFDKKIFNKLDTLVLSKCFDNAYEYSIMENIERINCDDLSSHDILNILENFIYSVQYKTILNGRELFELVKLSLLPTKKLNKVISSDLYLKIASYLKYVSHETKLISFDFLILRIVDNFLLKVNNINNKNLSEFYLALKNSIYEKMISFSYINEIKEKEATMLCWVDMLLSAVIKKEIDISSFILITKKILIITQNSLYLLWKLANSINYILSQNDFLDLSSLKEYKKILEKQIENRYTYANISTNELQNIMINLLANQNIVKDDYYYFFDALSSIATQSEKNKFFCIQLCEYIVYYNNKKRIFSYRFIRKYFIDIILKLFNKNDIIQIKIKELNLLINLWFNDIFFCFEKKRILQGILNILKSINSKTFKLNHNNFYKYCEALDYMLASDSDYNIIDIIDFLAFDNGNKSRISKHFKLHQSISSF